MSPQSMSPQSKQTICALATPRGEGALGVVRLSGPLALEMLERACGGRSLCFEHRVVRWVKLYHPVSGELVDEVLATYFKRPRSYTGEDLVEVSGHGGSRNLDRLLALFVELGARPAAPGEFTRRAYVNGRLDLVQAEAVAAVIAARSERALRNAHALLDGRLGAAIEELRQAVVVLLAALEATIDFSDEPEVGDDLLRRQREPLATAARRARALAESYRQGRLLEGVSVALVGRVNAGKSSLFNALVGRERALVSTEPGTTRDYLEAEVSWQGVGVTLIDTAGQREAGVGSVEHAGQALGAARVERCDAVIEVVDLTEDWGETAAGATVIAANKLDLLDQRRLDESLARLSKGAGGRRVVAVSAVTGAGLAELVEGVIAGVGGEEAEAEDESVQVTSARQHEALARAAGALEDARAAVEEGLSAELVAEHGREALWALGEVTGAHGTRGDELLDTIFGRFCIGK